MLLVYCAGLAVTVLGHQLLQIPSSYIVLKFAIAKRSKSRGHPSDHMFWRDVVQLYFEKVLQKEQLMTPASGNVYEWHNWYQVLSIRHPLHSDSRSLSGVLIRTSYSALALAAVAAFPPPVPAAVFGSLYLWL